MKCFTKQVGICLFLSLLLFRCGSAPANEEEARQAPYFDLAGFITAQAQRLSDRNAKLQKEMNINNQIEQLKLDSVDWEQELKLFTEADINKPVLFDSYVIDTSASGISYHAKTSEHKIRRIYLKKSGEFISEVVVKFEEKNPIYHSERTMKLELENDYLKAIHIQGYQKMWADDTLRYKLKAVVE